MSQSANLSRGYAALRQSIASAGGSATSAGWLAKTFDPYHDHPLVLRGIPDQTVGKTVLREFRAQMDINRPNSFNPTLPWNVQISHLPVLTRTDVVAAMFQNNQAAIQPHYPECTQVGAMYPVMVTYTQGTSDILQYAAFPPSSFDATWTFVDIGGPGVASKLYAGLEPMADTSVLDEQQWRLVSQAFEVTNTTAAQYVNGLCTVYRVNSEFDLEHPPLGANDPTGAWEDPGAVLPTQFISLPFNNPNDVQNLPLTSTWSAAEGCYCVAALDPSELGRWSNHFFRYPLLGVNTTGTGPMNVLSNPNFWKRYAYDTDNHEFLFKPDVNYVTPVQTSGAMFTGLDPNTTLVLNARWVIEFMPDPRDADITLSGQSVEYDQAALELYARTVRNMPPGVPVSWNSIGEWFESVMKLLASIAPTVGGIVGTAVAGPAGGALGSAWGSFAGQGITEANRLAKRQKLY